VKQHQEARSRAQLVTLAALVAALMTGLLTARTGTAPTGMLTAGALAYAGTVTLAALRGPLHLGWVLLTTAKYISLTVVIALFVGYAGTRAARDLSRGVRA
jgi:hypothetical protein